MPALIFSIIISDSPFVASGFAARKIKDIGLKNFLQKILNGELDMISGNYLFLFLTSFLIIFVLAIINIYFNKRSNFIKWLRISYNFKYLISTRFYIWAFNFIHFVADFLEFISEMELISFLLFLLNSYWWTQVDKIFVEIKLFYSTIESNINFRFQETKYATQGNGD